MLHGLPLPVARPISCYRISFRIAFSLSSHTTPDPAVPEQPTYPELVNLACQWAQAQEEFILERGTPLDPRAWSDAAAVGVRDIRRIRLLVVDRIPMPEMKELAEAAKRIQVITPSSRAVTMGHGVMVRADCWADRELIVHQFVHIMQCERCGGFGSYLQQYLLDRQSSADQFGIGCFEEEARRLARDLCVKAA